MGILYLGFLLAGCASQKAQKNPEARRTPTQTPGTVIITGWFSIIWNGEPHYSITDEMGGHIRLLIDPEVARPLGGPLALNRKKVTITGKPVNDPQGTIRVLSIKIEPDH